MAYRKKLGIFVKIPEPGKVKTRLVPPLNEEDACRLYDAFLSDLFLRLDKLKKVSATVFYDGEDPGPIRDRIPARFALVQQEGETLGNRMENAFRSLLDTEGSMAILIGSDSPDVPLVFIKRAFMKLKHKDIVLGPATDGGYYMVGLKRVVPSLFNGIEWGTGAVLRETLERVGNESLTCSLLPLWYDVDNVQGLSFLESMLIARRIERSGRLQHTEHVLASIKER
jgi:rSAM/selenodomain-associated transferase 1